MAVEIPVIVDIEGAFQDAAKRVKRAMAPLERELSAEALSIEIKVGIDEEGNNITRRMSTIIEAFRAGHDVAGILQVALKQISSELIQVAQSGDKVRFTTLLEAKHYIEDMVSSMEVAKSEINGLAQTMEGLNARLAAAKTVLETTRINSPQWKAAAQEIRKVTAEMEKVQRKMAEMGTKSGSIDRINLKLQQLTAQWNAMSRTQKFDADGNLKASAQKVIDKYKALTAEAQQFGLSLEEAANKGKVATKEVNLEMAKTDSRLLSLIKNSLRLIALHSATSFIRNVREVTAQFELQKVALGSIIQDTEKASSLFKQIKAAAVESPFEIKDLVTYTKQLSAYQIETEKLFDTTMELADISSGLGVDMGRLILAFGQVRAAAVLRGQELRQFTEAGIPLVDKLAQKFSELNNRAVSTAEVFELISRRAVPFSMIEEIFNDLTSAGGAFYKMQEKQAETLLGQWNNLKDAVSIMYDEIGNTSAVHDAMEALISGAKTVMQNWRLIATTLKGVATQYLAVKFASLFLPTLIQNTKLLEKAEIAEARAKELSNRAHKNGLVTASIKSLENYAKYTRLAAEATTGWGRAINSVKAFLAGNWIQLVLSAVMAIGAAIAAAVIESRRLNKELDKIQTEGEVKLQQSIRNFEKLANAAVEAADGSKAQADAMEELKRTYGDILPASDLVIERLREMQGNYESLTRAIAEKINMQIREQKLEEIQSDYTTKITKRRKTLQKLLKDQGFSREEISFIFSEIQNAVDDGLITMEMSVEEQAKAIERIVRKYTGKYIELMTPVYATTTGGVSLWVRDEANKTAKAFSGLVKVYSNLDSAVQEVDEDMSDSIGTLGKYAKSYKELQKVISEIQGVGETNYAKTESRIEQTVDQYMNYLRERFAENKIDIAEVIDFKRPDFKVMEQLAESVNDDAARAALSGAIKQISKEYEKLVPDDKITALSKAAVEQFAKEMGISMDKVRQHIKNATDDGEEYLKNLQEALKKSQQQLQSMIDYNAQRKGTFVELPAYTEAQINDVQQDVNLLEKLIEVIASVIHIETTHTKANKDYLQALRQNIGDITDAYKKYQDLLQYMSKEDALSNIDILFPSLEGWQPSFENMLSKLESMLTEYEGDADATRLIQQAIANIRFDNLKDNIEQELSDLSDEIKRSETARNFYQNILDMTGDSELAANLSVSVYGGIGKDFQERLQDQLNTALSKLDAENVSDELRQAFADQDFETILANLDKFPEKWQEVLKRLASENEKYNAEWYTDFVKTYQKTKTYEERINILESQRRQKLSEAGAMGVSASDKDAVNAYFNKKIADVQLEAMKDTYTWTKAFEDLDGVSTQTLRNLIDLIDEYINKYGKDLEPQQLKELARSREQAENQIKTRDAYRSAVAALKDYNNASRKKLIFESAFIDSGDEYIQILDEQQDAIHDLEDALNEIEAEFNAVASSTKDLMSVFASDDAASYFGEQLDNLSKTMSGVKSASIGIAQLASGMITPQAIVQTLTGIADVVSGVFGAANAAKIRRIDKELKEQDLLLGNLEESYNKLSATMDKTFGNDYVAAYTQQLDVMAAQQEAYLKQAQLERDKGKKADQDKIREYEASAREAADGMMQLREEMVSTFAGADLASAAESFADAWLSAYEEFGDTSVAIEERMTEMVKNIMKKAALSGIAQNILGGWYESLADVQDWNAQTIAVKWKEAMALVDPMVQGMQTFANSMQAEGVSLRATAGKFTGISRDIAGASEESINGLAAGINTQNAYMSFINQNVAAILAYLTGGEVTPASTASGAASDQYKDAVLLYTSNLPQMRDDLASIRSLLSSVIKQKGTPASAYVNTNL